MGDALIFLDAETAHHGVHTVGREDAHQIIFNGDVEFRFAGVALTAGPAAQLIVDPAAFVAFGAQNIEAASVQRLLFLDFDVCLDLGAKQRDFAFGKFAPEGFFLGGAFLLQAHFIVAAELNVGAAAGHVGGNGDGAGHAGLGHDEGFLFVMARVEHLVRNALRGEQVGEKFGLLDRGSAQQDRLALGIGRAHFLDDLGVFCLGRTVDNIILIDPANRFVRGQINDFKFVNVRKFGRFGQRRTGHAGELLVEAEIILERDRGQGLVLGLDVDALFRLDGLVEAFGKAASFHHPSAELVDQHDLIVLDDVILVPRIKLVGAQGLV